LLFKVPRGSNGFWIDSAGGKFFFFYKEEVLSQVELVGFFSLSGMESINDLCLEMTDEEWFCIYFNI